MAAETFASLPEMPVWEQPWFNDALKSVLAMFVVLVLVFGVLKPLLKSFITGDAGTQKALEGAGREAATVRYDAQGRPIPQVAEGPARVGELPKETEDLLLLEAPQSYEKRLEYVRKLVDEDPKLVAQVIKTWVSADG